MWEVNGLFEIHITSSEDSMVQLAELADRENVKFTHILLDRGVTASQPMITVTGKGNSIVQRTLLNEWRDICNANDIIITRMKVESVPWAPGVPVDDEEAAPDKYYFEHHFKIKLPSKDERLLTRLTSIVVPHDARVSSNPRRVKQGFEERFVTQRCHGVGFNTATARRNALEKDIFSAGYEILEAEQEFVVYDSNFDLDKGWIRG